VCGGGGLDVFGPFHEHLACRRRHRAFLRQQRRSALVGGVRLSRHQAMGLSRHSGAWRWVGSMGDLRMRICAWGVKGEAGWAFVVVGCVDESQLSF
jgi:hypothetical protein